MSYADWQRAGMLYVPVMLALLAGVLGRRRPRRFAGCLLSLLWATVTLLVVGRLNSWEHWWSFHPSDAVFAGMPLELYVGWIVLWGLVPQLALASVGIGWTTVAMAVIDLIAMPLCKPVLLLGPRWLVGETAAVFLVLLPALCLARWTIEEIHLPLRAALQVVTSGTLFLYFLTEVAFTLRPGPGWQPLLHMPSWERQIALQVVCVLALPGVAAVMEFTQRGLGTPIPYDPPRCLVTTGIYRYLANPMQVSCCLVMLAWAAVLRNSWLLLAAMISAIYSVGLALWDEGSDLEQRFGPAWVEYRKSVRNWVPRWRPYDAPEPALVYIARTCGPCSELRQWIEARAPVGLRIVDAETLESGTIRRLRYDPGDGSDDADGVRALGRVLEHLNLGWALAGAALRLPGVWQSVQVVMDASGLEPRLLEEDA